MKQLLLIALFYILTWVHFTHCQDRIDVLTTEFKLLRNATLKEMADFKQKQNETQEVLKGYGDLQQKINDILAKLSGMQEKQEHVESKLQEMQENQGHIKGKLQEMQEKLQHVEINLQEFHHELEHMKGAVNSNQDSLQNISAKLETLEDISAKLETLEGIHQETKGCLGRENLELFKNISSAEQRELESLLRQEISGVISLLETGGIDECSEGSHNCTDHEACTDKLYQYQCSCLPGFARDDSRCEDVDECAQGKDDCSPLATCRNSIGSYSCSCNPPSEGDGRSCSCPRGFAQEGSNCEDIDECTEGKDECSPQAICRNSVGSYSCSCNPPFEGDGRTCEFPCESEAKYIEGLGCVKIVEEFKTFEGMKATCHQAGGRLLQDFTYERLQQVVRAFPYSGGWVGVREGKWLESGLPLQEELWTEGSRGSDPSGRRGLCGYIFREYSSSSWKVGQLDCSERLWYGYCQILIPQK